MFIDKEELLQLLEQKYGDLTNPCGGNIFTAEGYQWLSLTNIVEIINNCNEYE